MKTLKPLLPLLVVLTASQSQAVSWRIFGACKNTPVHEGTYQADLTKSVGALSLEIFDANKIPYVGSAEGINSIINSPIGLDSIEVVSDTELRAYGWCYTINGKQPTEMPDKIHFKSQDDKLTWFYAYSTNKNNEWTDYCSPAYWIAADQFCK
ncbi:DUF4430 domain-containing protein [Bdellovibrio bacteriovorus]|uniref:DUF4430 domain-containing protein n=1 Tax=Bdellovibrio bacteriovorus TaxID=959 RepID=UPI0035A6E395